MLCAAAVGCVLLVEACTKGIDPAVLKARADDARATLAAIKLDTVKTLFFAQAQYEELLDHRARADALFDVSNWEESADAYPEIITAYQALADRTAQVAWVHVSDQPLADSAVAVHQTGDGGYIVAGTIMIGKDFARDLYLTKLTPTGEETWTQTYGGTDKEAVGTVRPLADGGYILAGQTSSFRDYSGDVYLIRTDALGNALWSETFGKTGSEVCVDVLPLDDGGFLAVGRSFAGNYGMDAYLVRTDGDGQLAWERTLGGADDQFISDVVRTADGTILLAGSAGTLNDNDLELFLMMIDAEGNELWRASPEAPGFIDPGSVHVVHTLDGGYSLTAGYLSRDSQVRAWSGTEEGEDIALIKLDASGEAIWTKTFGGSKWDAPRGVHQTADGGYAIVGATRSFGAGGEDVYVIKTNAEGEEEWSRTIGTPDNEKPNATLRTADGGFLIVGGKMIGRSGKTLDAYVVKTDERGHTWVDGAPFSSPGVKPESIQEGVPPTTAPPGSGDLAQGPLALRRTTILL